MKKVFTHENRLILFNMKNVLEDNGIECLVKNEFASGGVGDLAPFETWPELWVDEDDAEKAQGIFAGLNQSDQSDWSCARCGETNASSFKICWNCATEHFK